MSIALSATEKTALTQRFRAAWQTRFADYPADNFTDIVRFWPVTPRPKAAALKELHNNPFVFLTRVEHRTLFEQLPTILSTDAQSLTAEALYGPALAALYAAPTPKPTSAAKSRAKRNPAPVKEVAAAAPAAPAPTLDLEALEQKLVAALAPALVEQLAARMLPLLRAELQQLALPAAQTIAQPATPAAPFNQPAYTVTLAAGAQFGIAAVSFTSAANEVATPDLAAPTAATATAAEIKPLTLFDLPQRQLTINGALVDLNEATFLLLYKLAADRAQVFTLEQLADYVDSQRPHQPPLAEASLRVYIINARSVLKDYHPRLADALVARRGLGYQLNYTGDDLCLQAAAAPTPQAAPESAPESITPETTPAPLPAPAATAEPLPEPAQPPEPAPEAAQPPVPPSEKPAADRPAAKFKAPVNFFQPLYQSRVSPQDQGN